MSSTCTVANGTGSSTPVEGLVFTTLPQMRRKKKKPGSTLHLKRSAASATVSPSTSLVLTLASFEMRCACRVVILA